MKSFYNIIINIEYIFLLVTCKLDMLFHTLAHHDVFEFHRIEFFYTNNAFLI